MGASPTSTPIQTTTPAPAVIGGDGGTKSYATPIAAITGGLGALGGFTSFIEAKRRASRIEDLQKIASAQATARVHAIGTRASVQKRTVNDDMRRIIGETQAGASAGGRGADRGVAALMRQAALTGAINRKTISMGEKNLMRDAILARDAQFSSLESGKANPWLQAAVGTLTGVSTGLSLGQAGLAAMNYDRRMKEAKGFAALSPDKQKTLAGIHTPPPWKTHRGGD